MSIPRPNVAPLSYGLSVVLWLLAGCASSPSNPGSPSTGGANGAGGRTDSGGTGGTSTGSGGTAGTGGTSAGSGGTAGTAGHPTGGAPGAGGANSTGGVIGTGTGGTDGTGGATGSGGISGAGGLGGTGGGNSGGRAGTGGAGGSIGGGGGAGTAGAAGAGLGGAPCDIYAAGNTPCVGAHSTVRALYQSYGGSLYQVKRASDGKTKDIPVISAGGFADSSQQDTFCAGTTCTISVIYDQSPQGNHLPVSPPVHWLSNGGTPVNAAAAKITVGGHPVYGIYVVADAGNTYRNNKTKGVATGDEPEAMYMVADGKRYNNRCCFDYGNVETTGNDDGNGTMETLNWSNITQWSSGAGNGPWVMADLENGVFAGGPHTVASNMPVTANYVTLMLKGPSGNHLTLKAGSAQSGTLTVEWDGARPNGYTPMKKEGALELGTGGDGSAGGIGTFFVGAVTSGNPSDDIDAAVQTNVVAAGYGH